MTLNDHFSLKLFDYRIQIHVHSETRFRFTQQIEWPFSSKHFMSQVKMDSSRFHGIWIWFRLQPKRTASYWCRRGISGSLSAKLQSGRPEDFPVSPQLHIYVMPSCSYRVSVSIAWTELYGQVNDCVSLSLCVFVVR